MWAAFMLSGMFFLAMAFGDSIDNGTDAHLSPWTYLALACIAIGHLLP